MRGIKQMFMRKKCSVGGAQGKRHPYQQRFSNWLQQRFEKLSARTRSIVLIGVLLFMGAYAIGLLAGGITYRFRKVDQISKPMMVEGHARISMEQAQYSILRFRQIMDSLSTTPAGRRTRDSILTSHPGILDTIAELEGLMNPINK